jgi:hypothetical protein
VTVAAAGLPDGVHGSSITVSAGGASNTPRTVPVTLTVNAAPRISLNPVTLDFAATSGGPGSSKAVSVTNGGAGTLAWSALPDAAWITVTPSSGSLGPASSEPLTIRIDPAGLPEGAHTGAVVVSAGSAVNTPQGVVVNLQVGPPPAREPFEETRAGYACGALGAELLLAWPLARGLRRRRPGR